MAEITAFIANHQSNSLTVNETDAVTFTCTAVGRPTPAMRIEKNRQQVADMSRGQISPEDTATLVHRTSRAQCGDAGQYKCQLLNNDNPVGNAEYVTLLVNCESVCTLRLIFCQYVVVLLYPLPFSIHRGR